MKYYVDCEFDNQHGDNPLLSIALVSETGKGLYAVTDYGLHGVIHDKWVYENVKPYILDVPASAIEFLRAGLIKSELSKLLEDYFAPDEYPHVIADWPVDIKYLCDLLITGPGTMIAVPGMKFSVKRVDAYPTELLGAVQHNAWWDAMALRHKLKDMELLGRGKLQPSCVNHPDRPSRENLDGDDLCQECCNTWARNEGAAAMGYGDDL